QFIESRRGGNYRAEAVDIEKEHPPLGGDGRSLVLALQPFFPFQIARRNVEAAGDAIVGDCEEQFAPDNGTATIGRPVTVAPGEVMETQLAGRLRLHGKHWPLQAARGENHVMRHRWPGHGPSAFQVRQNPQLPAADRVVSVELVPAHDYQLL